MKREFDKKRFWIIVGIIAVCEVFAVYLVTRWKYLFPKYEVSEVYTRYASHPGDDRLFRDGFCRSMVGTKEGLFLAHGFYNTQQRLVDSFVGRV